MIPDEKIEDLRQQIDENPERVKKAFNIFLDTIPNRTKEKKFKQKLNSAEGPEEMKEAIDNYIDM